MYDQERNIVYTEDSKQFALNNIARFSDDFGGTEILQPLRFAQETLDSNKKKRIFLLTDGSVSSKHAVIEQARLHNMSTRVFSFGLGSGCDKDLVHNVAAAGRGTSTIVQDNDPNLNGLVIRALSNAMEPSLCDTRYGFNDQIIDAKELYRNTHIYATKLVNEAEFDRLRFTFKTKSDDTREAINHEFTRGDFQEVDGDAGEALVKMAVSHQIDSGALSAQQQKELSLKHQVLCDHTAIVGVLKQTDKASGELQESVIKFKKEERPDFEAIQRAQREAEQARRRAEQEQYRQRQ